MLAGDTSTWIKGEHVKISVIAVGSLHRKQNVPGGIEIDSCDSDWQRTLSLEGEAAEHST